MSNSHTQPPGYAGIGDVARIGLSVDECARRIARFGFVSKALMRAQAARMPAIANWEFKAMLGRQIWECATHWGGWRARLGELRGHERDIELHAHHKLGDFFAELIFSNSDAELAIALYEIALPEYRAALLRYCAATNPLVDAPTVRLCKHTLLDIDAQLAFGEAALAALLPAALEDAAALDAWRAHARAYLMAAGGVDGVGPEQPSFSLPAPRSDGGLRLPQAFARDARFKQVVPKLNPYGVDDTHDALLHKMWVRAQEMTAAELCASVLYEWDELPYQGCLDLARHCWDETRHSLFGQAALEAEGIPLESTPSWVGYAGHTMPFSAQKRYAHLAIATEATMMRHPGGKRGEWEWCRDQARHALMTTFQDFDWADEVNHVGFGRDWLIRFFFNGDRSKAQALADETMRDRLAFYADYEKTGGAEGY